MNVIVTIDLDGRPYPGVMHRVSSQGAFLADMANLPIGATIGLSIPTRPQPVRMVGKVVYRVDRDSAGVLGTQPGLGIRFTSQLDEQHLATVISRPAHAARPARRSVFSGSTDDLALEKVLTVLESTRKSGRLNLTSGLAAAWIDFDRGRIVGARSSSSDGSLLEVIFDVLDWTPVTFELIPAPPGDDAGGPGTTVAEVLLERAVRVDHDRRRAARG